MIPTFGSLVQIKWWVVTLLQFCLVWCGQTFKLNKLPHGNPSFIFSRIWGVYFSGETVNTRRLITYFSEGNTESKRWYFCSALPCRRSRDNKAGTTSRYSDRSSNLWEQIRRTLIVAFVFLSANDHRSGEIFLHSHIQTSYGKQKWATEFERSLVVNIHTGTLT